MIKEVNGVIIKETSYGETSKIINIFTEEYGVIGVMCKGAKSLKSKFRSSTMIPNYCKFNIYYKENKLSLLHSVDVIEPFNNIKSDILLISYVIYIIELISQVINQTDEKEIYNNFLNALFKINNGLNPQIITNILEVKCLDYLGVGINLTSCTICGTRDNIVTLSSEKGGLLCKDCYKGEKLFSLDTIKVLNMYYLVDIKSISKINIKNEQNNDINVFLKGYYEDYTGIYFKSTDFLKQISIL